MAYRINGLAPESFAPLWACDAAALAKQGIRRVVADSDRGFPCRISLQDAAAGETLLLLPYRHHAVDGPYQASGAIFIRQHAGQCAHHLDQVPSFLSRRMLSLRAYDAPGMLRHAEVVSGDAVDTAIRSSLARPGIAYLHLHNAAWGCYLASVEPA